MRLASEKKAGYYPIADDVIPLIRQHLRYPEGDWSALDPCAGEGRAFNSLVDSGAHRYCIELDAERAAQCRTLMPDAQILGPADALTARISSGSFSLVYLNPPYAEDRVYGDRLEPKFLNRALAWLKSQGVLVAVVPEHQLGGQFGEILRHSFRDIKIVEVPEAHRNYNEVVVFATRRSQSLRHGTAAALPGLSGFDEVPVYEIPESQRPRIWEKVNLTDTEYAEQFKRSPLNKLFETPRIKPLGRPLLPLGKGHLAICVVSGANNGAVYPEDGDVHVIRGVAEKEEYEKSREHEDTGKAMVTKIVRSERPKVVVRAVYRDGRFVNYE